jgi:hypothetical protein
LWHLIGFDSFFQITPASSLKNERFSQETHIQIPLSSQGLKLSKIKPGWRVAAIHFWHTLNYGGNNDVWNDVFVICWDCSINSIQTPRALYLSRQVYTRYYGHLSKKDRNL